MTAPPRTRRRPAADAGRTSTDEQFAAVTNETTITNGTTEVGHADGHVFARADRRRPLDAEALTRAVRLEQAGWTDLRFAAGHLVVAFRPSCGSAAPSCVREQLLTWLNENDDDALDALADALVSESRDVKRRLKSVAS